MILLILTIFLCRFAKLTAAAPIPVEYVTWQGEPNVRGTWSILSSCVTTLVLCVYTAVHMNVSPAWEKPERRKWHVLGWVSAGIFAPELVVWTAWCQLSEARRLTKEMEILRTELCTKDEIAPSQTAAGENIELTSSDQSTSLLPNHSGDTTALRKLLDSWTLRHSFFVIMGGYQFNPEAIDKVMYGTDPRIVLHKRSFLALLKMGHANKIPLLSPRDLADRSKADNVTKIISCVQGAWLMFQLFGRLVGHLTITELEVNTFAHVVCAIAMYTCWMYKPLNVQQPVFVATRGLEGWLCVHSDRSFGLDQLFEFKQFLHDSSPDAEPPVVHVHTVDDISCEQCNKNQSLSYGRRPHGILLGLDVDLTLEEVALSFQQNNGGHYVIDYVRRATYPASGNRPDIRDREVGINLKREVFLATSQDVKRLLKLWDLAERDSEFGRRDVKTAPIQDTSMVLSDTSGDDRKFFLMTVVSCIYGGLHASLWNHHFPTAAEMWIWRVSSLFVAGNGILLIFLIITMWISDSTPGETKEIFLGHDIFKLTRGLFDNFWKLVIGEMDEELPLLTLWGYKLVLVVLVILQLVFGFCRVFLFLDAFLTLRSQPPSVYLTPQWTQWFPHL